jgi:hypothetical protein
VLDRNGHFGGLPHCAWAHKRAAAGRNAQGPGPAWHHDNLLWAAKNRLINRLALFIKETGD